MVTEMENNLVKRLVIKVIKKNIGLFILMFIAVCGVVITSLIPPQLLKLIFDQNLVPKNSDGLLKLAMIYFGVILLIGLFDFIKEASLTIFGQKFSKKIRIETVSYTHLTLPT